MIQDVFITCAITGAGDTVSKSPHVPVTPEAIANDALAAAVAGAGIVHIHVRDPETGLGARDPALYREVVERIRASSTDVVVNLTAGMGGDLVLGGREEPLPLDPQGTDLAGATERLAHVRELRPEICTLDCGSLNFAAGGDYVMLNTPDILREMAKQVRSLGVRAELEIFDTGHLVLAKEMLAEGLFDAPLLMQLCMGIPYGAPNDLNTLMALINALPPETIFSTFAIGRMQLPYVGLAPLVGGHVRVGLEDNLYLSRHWLATNTELVERAVAILRNINVNILGPQAIRDKLKLTRHD